MERSQESSSSCLTVASNVERLRRGECGVLNPLCSCCSALEIDEEKQSSQRIRLGFYLPTVVHRRPRGLHLHKSGFLWGQKDDPSLAQLLSGGGHFNPAVSLAVTLIGGLNAMLLLPYWISQLAGGLIGAALAKAVSTEERFWNASGAAFATVQEQRQVSVALGAEIILTMLLALAVCMGAVNEKTKGPLAPFSIGFSVVVDILAGGGISGACMNPARAFGPAVIAGYWDFHWIYWLGPLLAGLLVGLIIRLFIGDEKTRLILKAR